MLRLGCCCYICKRWFFVDSQEGLLSSRGGGGGGGQTYWHQAYSSSLWHCFGPLTGFPAVSLQSL